MEVDHVVGVSNNQLLQYAYDNLLVYKIVQTNSKVG